MDCKKNVCTALVQAVLSLAVMSPVRDAFAAEGNATEGSNWDVALGAGVVSLPKYPGSKARRAEPLPLISVRYKRFFIGGVPGGGTPAGLGAYLFEDDRLKLGVALSGDVIKPRKESDDSRHLRGLGDINGTLRGSLFASYTLDWFTLRGNVSYDLQDHHNHEGMLASLEAVARYSPTPRLSLTAGPEVTLANRTYMQTFFGIDALQSQRSGYAEFTPKAGVALIGLSVGAGYRLSSHWTLSAHVAAQRLQGDAARSVIVENKNQNVYALFSSYRF